MEKFPNPSNPVSAAKEQKQMYSHRGRAHKQTERRQYILGNFSIADEYYSDCLWRKHKRIIFQKQRYHLAVWPLKEKIAPQAQGKSWKI